MPAGRPLKSEIENWIREDLLKSGYDGFVYLIFYKASKYEYLVKIGKSKDWRKRISQIKGYLPFNIQTLCVIQDTQFHQIEKHLHNKFRLYRRNGEWFSFTESSDSDNNIFKLLAHITVNYQNVIKCWPPQSNNVWDKMKWN